MIFVALWADTGRAATEVARLHVVAGDAQSAQAFTASTGPGYETAFPQSLVVRVDGSRRERASVRMLRFECVERDCRFALAEQGDDVTRVDTRSYDVRVVAGRATLPLTLSTDRVPGAFTVRVRAKPQRGDRSGDGVVIHLTVR